jgi:hypothetical protein
MIARAGRLFYTVEWLSKRLGVVVCDNGSELNGGIRDLKSTLMIQ